MPIDISPKDLAKKHAADASLSINWLPVARRIKIQPDYETKSGVIYIPEKNKEVFVRGTILALGPAVGLADDGVTVIERYSVGQRILYNKSHEIKYTGADGVDHYFLKENAVEGILAVDGSIVPENKENK